MISRKSVRRTNYFGLPQQYMQCMEREREREIILINLCVDLHFNFILTIQSMYEALSKRTQSPSHCLLINWFLLQKTTLWISCILQSYQQKLPGFTSIFYLWNCICQSHNPLTIASKNGYLIMILLRSGNGRFLID